MHLMNASNHVVNKSENQQSVFGHSVLPVKSRFDVWTCVPAVGYTMCFHTSSTHTEANTNNDYTKFTGALGLCLSL